MKWLVGVSLLVLLALFGAGYFLCSGKKGAAEEDNLSDDAAEVKSLTKSKTNVAAKAVKTEPQADANGMAKTVTDLEAQLVQQRIAVAESLAGFKRGMLPLTVTVILDKPLNPKDMR